MFDEITTQSAEYTAPPAPRKDATSAEIERLEAAVSTVLEIDKRIIQMGEQAAVQFTGTLKLEDAEAAYDILDAELDKLNYYAYFLLDDEDQHVIQIIRGRIQDPPERPWEVNLVLFILTLLSMMLFGVTIEGVPISEELLTQARLLEGAPYAFGLMLILGAHELGHYFAAQYHRVKGVTLPYFIPMPIGLGTLGAFIQLRTPIRNRNQLFDIGVAGPLAGLVFAIPVLLVGVATADVIALPNSLEDCEDPDNCSYLLEGNSLVYAATKYVVHGEFLPSDERDINLNQLAFAGWTGLLVTSLNLIPVGQLDGGHILYTLFGRRAKDLYYPVLFGLLLLTVFVNSNWFLWMFLLLIFGRIHATPLNDITPLSSRRRLVGYFAIVILILIFIPSPFTVVTVT